jgi:hypothetical protein
MRKGLHEVLPGSCFSGLSAEDFRLLLCGCPHIDVDVIRGITLFHDESRELMIVCVCAFTMLNQDLFLVQNRCFCYLDLIQFSSSSCVYL